MKVLAIVLLSITLIAATKIPLRDGITPKKLGPVGVMPMTVGEQIPWESLKDYVLDHGKTQDGYIQANVTDYFLDILDNVRTLMIEQGFDPMELSDEKLSLFPVGSMTLHNGYISGISSMKTSGSVLAKYTFGSRVLEFVVPLSFDSILINYDYITQITLIKISGDVKAKVTNFKINMRAGFNFTSFHAFVDDVDVRDSGKINFNFTGLGLLDWIIDAMTNVATGLFHHIILSVVNLVIYNPVHSIVDEINSIVDKILNPNATSYEFY